MNPFLMAPRELLSQWKLIRTELKDKTELEQLQTVLDFWNKAPLATMAYDPEALDEYPTPWDMMNENDWCQNSIAVGMDFTLRLGGWMQDRLEIHMIRDYDLSIQKLVVVVDGKYLLNYEYGCVTSLPITTKHDVLGRWKYSGRHYERVE
jgi:hypothetical protein